MMVRIPSPLDSYTSNQRYVEAEGDTINEILDDLDRQFPGIKFRIVDERGQIRKHMNIFVNREVIRDCTLDVDSEDEIFIAQSLSGG